MRRTSCRNKSIISISSVAEMMKYRHTQIGYLHLVLYSALLLFIGYLNIVMDFNPFVLVGLIVIFIVIGIQILLLANV